MLVIGDTVTISKSRFENNKAKSGIIAISADNTFIDECEFINNSAEAYVGVSNIWGTMTINNSYFVNNTAERSARVMRNSQYCTAIISNCVFENNIGNEGNYSIDNNYGTIYLYNNTINTQSSEIHNYGGNITCSAGCLGCGDCANACPVSAIGLQNGVAFIKRGECIGCGLCVKTCPKNLIELVPEIFFTKVLCRNTEKGAIARKNCTNACIGCKKCEKVCPSGAIKVVHSVAEIDYSLCTGCGECEKICPRKVIWSGISQSKQGFVRSKKDAT
jgi:ferredoxin